MPDTLHAISRSLSSDVQTLTTISQNVANLNTPGYRGVRHVPDFSEQPGLRTAVIQQDGGITPTSSAFDLALRGGPGFFVVERDGKMLLTRSGAFHRDQEGFLATPRGDRVQGLSGPMLLPHANVRVDGRGEIWDGNLSLGVLQIIAVADSGNLKAAGDATYSYEGGISEWTGSVLQGALERANVDPAEETVRLMETTRHAESVQRAISIYDRAMDVGINRLGDN